ncbi:MAG TPA: hypothetical protein VEC36_09510, partial [Patescibacteria group bacterium]|nr:hypothetical protein [Patescibacteria group bacterium]
WVRTDANGKFVLDYKFFPSTGGKIPRIYENGTSPGNCILKDSVTIYIVRPNSGAAIEKLQIDKSKVLEKTFILQ